MREEGGDLVGLTSEACLSDNGCDHALNNHDHFEACDAEQVNTRILNIIKNYNLTSLIMHSQCGMQVTSTHLLVLLQYIKEFISV